MPLSHKNTRVFHRRLYAGELETITMLKRNDDQQEGTVVAIKLFQCRRSIIVKSGEQVAGGMTADHHTIWHIPRTEMDRTGINHINSLDRVVDKEGRYWQPESTTTIEDKLFSNHVHFQALRVDPPNNNVKD